MDIQHVMTADPRVCRPGASVCDAARLMLQEDVGEIPVVDEARHVVGVITDRDIVVRCVAADINPQHATVESCMTTPALTIGDNASLEDCADLMAGQQIRRVPVVDADGVICGIVAQADLEATDARGLKARVAARVSVPH
jgi:CBS domain-containing protein